MIELPDIAISVRQPWAWAIIHAGKGLENRTEGAIRMMAKMHRLAGRVAIHASKGITRAEYEDAADFMDYRLGIKCPPAADLLRGGIIGSAEIVGVVKQSADPWFIGPRALALANEKPCEFIPSVGALGLFKWKPADASILPAPARWMLAA